MPNSVDQKIGKDNVTDQYLPSVSNSHVQDHQQSLNQSKIACNDQKLDAEENNASASFNSHDAFDERPLSYSENNKIYLDGNDNGRIKNDQNSTSDEYVTASTSFGNKEDSEQFSSIFDIQPTSGSFSMFSQRNKTNLESNKHQARLDNDGGLEYDLNSPDYTARNGMYYLEDHDYESIASESVASFDENDVEYKDGLPAGIQIYLSPEHKLRKKKWKNRFRHFGDKFSAQSALILVLASIFTLIKGIFNSVPVESYWITIGALLSCETKYGASLKVASQKMLGTLLAGLLGTAITALLAFLPPPACLSCSYKPVIYCFVIFAFIYFSTFLRQNHSGAYFSRLTNVTFLATIIASFHTENSFSEGDRLVNDFVAEMAIKSLIRTGFILLGILLALFGSLFFFPLKVNRAHRLQVADILANSGSLLETTILLGYIDTSSLGVSADPPHRTFLMNSNINKDNSDSNVSQIISGAASIYDVDDAIHAPPDLKDWSRDSHVVHINNNMNVNTKTRSSDNKKKDNKHISDLQKLQHPRYFIRFGKNKATSKIETKKLKNDFVGQSPSPSSTSPLSSEAKQHLNFNQHKDFSRVLSANTALKRSPTSIQSKKETDSKKMMETPMQIFKRKVHPFAVRVARTLEKERARYEISASKELRVFEDSHIMLVAPMDRLVRKLRNTFYDIIALYSDRLAFFKSYTSMQSDFENPFFVEMLKNDRDLGEQWVFEWLNDNISLSEHLQHYKTDSFSLETIVLHISEFMSSLSHIVLLSTSSSSKITIVELQTRLIVSKDLMNDNVLRAIEKELFYVHRQLNLSINYSTVPHSSPPTVTASSSKTHFMETPYPHSSSDSFNKDQTDFDLLPKRNSVLSLKYSLLLRLRHITLTMLEINECIIRMISKTYN